MIEKNLEYIYNLDYIICVPSNAKNLYEGFTNTFKNVLLFNNTVEDVSFFKQFFKQNNIKKVIFVDYLYEYDEIIRNFSCDITINFILTKALGSLSNEFNLLYFNKIMDLYKQNIITKIGVLDPNLYEILKKKYNVNLIYLTINGDFISNSKDNAIGLLNKDTDFKDSYYNELSGISLLDYKANIYNPTKVTKHFLKDFNINHSIFKNYNKMLSSSSINLFINFTSANLIPFLKSMNMGIPCILGNTRMLDKYTELKEYLVVDSDDDSNEIADKITRAIDNKEKIIKLYQKFKKDYDQECLKLANKFLESKETIKTDKNYEKLISVVVPVYNVEKYLKNSLDSIIKACKDDMEILLINDGSKDKSGEICERYAQKYPELIRYINQTNHGLGNVRNVGLKHAKGKYIASIDSDDTINPNFFTDAINYCRDNVDIVLYDWLSIIPEKECFPTPAMDEMLHFDNKYKKLLYATIMPSACNKIIKASLYKDLNIKYAEGLKFEDLSTNPLIMLKAEKIKYINKPYYEYLITPNSIMRTAANYDMIDIIKMVEDRLKKYENLSTKINLTEFRNYVFWWRIEELIINQIYNMKKNNRSKFINYMYKNIDFILTDLFNNNNFVNDVISKFDEETKIYIQQRNMAIVSKEFEKFIEVHIKNNTWKTITAAMILYNIDNRKDKNL